MLIACQGQADILWVTSLFGENLIPSKAYLKLVSCPMTYESNEQVCLADVRVDKYNFINVQPHFAFLRWHYALRITDLINQYFFHNFIGDSKVISLKQDGDMI